MFFSAVQNVSVAAQIGAVRQFLMQEKPWLSDVWPAIKKHINRYNVVVLFYGATEILIIVPYSQTCRVTEVLPVLGTFEWRKSLRLHYSQASRAKTQQDLNFWRRTWSPVCVSRLLPLPIGLLPWHSGHAVQGLLWNNDPDSAGTWNQLSILVWGWSDVTS